MNVKNEVTEIVCEIIGMQPDEIDPDASFSEDMGIDSLRALEILAAIENKYGITIDPERLKDMGSLNKVIKVTEEHMEACERS